MIFHCGTERRRELLRDAALPGAAALNGIDFLEVLDDPALPDTVRQRTLFLHFVKAVDPAFTDAQLAGMVRIEGGERIRGVTVLSVSRTDTDTALAVRVDRPGDFSTYTLRLVANAADPGATLPPDGIDPVLATVEFSFKAACDTDFDRVAAPCPPEPEPSPRIDYLARDHAGFRQLMLDRMAALLPNWRERNPAAVEVALVELLAYVADHLSYRQDAIATEAYLGTARRRVSVRRHARLLDYAVPDGSNARAWVQVRVSSDLVRAGTGAPSPVPRGTRLLTFVPDQPRRIAPDPATLARLLATRPAVFETVEDTDALFAGHNELRFYTWGDDRCCLPAGATHATLAGHRPNLGAGDVLILVETRGPESGREDEADPAHRHAVRLTAVRALAADGLTPLTDPLTGEAITEVAWHDGDALPFPLWLGAVADPDAPGTPSRPISVALGNIVLADHGLTVRQEGPAALGPAPAAALTWAAPVEARAPRGPIPPRFRPALAAGPVTWAATHRRGTDRPDGATTVVEPYDRHAAAAAVFDWRAADLLPAIALVEEYSGRAWQPRRDLLNARPFDAAFVLETEDDGTAALRFGDGEFGIRPEAGVRFTATYRVGNGARGNIAAGSLRHIISDRPEIEAVVQPLAARGGVDAEPVEDVRVRAPVAFRTQERAVTADDYARVAERFAGVQRAVATVRWTGSWHTVFVTVDRGGGLEVTPAFERDLRRHLERYRTAGHDLEVDGPRFVPLEIEALVCVADGFFRADVRSALLRALTSGRLPDGRPGPFHPDRLTFGGTVFLSPLWEAALAVPGVESVTFTAFRRQGQPGSDAVDSGRLLIGRTEIARLDNDPNFPERGVLRLTLAGGV